MMIFLYSPYSARNRGKKPSFFVIFSIFLRPNSQFAAYRENSTPLDPRLPVFRCFLRENNPGYFPKENPSFSVYWENGLWFFASITPRKTLFLTVFSHFCLDPEP
jgi:hypothetical protein